MIHGLSKHTTNAVGALDYFLDESYYDKQSGEWLKRDPEPVLLEGDPKQMRALCDSLSFKNRYTTGVLSFSPEETAKIQATPGLKESLIEDFRQFAYAGFKHDDSKAMLIVEHGHTNRLELHYLIPRVSLESGLYFNPFPPNYDGKTGAGNNYDFLRQNDAFVDHICEKYGLQNPRDPAISRQFKEPVFEKDKPNHDIRRQVVEAIDAQIDAGAINSRDDMFKFLESHGANITRKGENYFSFKFPEMAKAIKLEGELYGKQSFDEISKHYEERREAFETSRSSAGSRYDAVIAERASEIEERHGNRTEEAESANSIDPGAERELKETIQVLTDKLDNIGDYARGSAADFCAANTDVMSPSISSGDICEPGSTGDPVLDKVRRAYHSWLRQCEAEAERYRQKKNGFKSGLGKAVVNFANYFLSVFTGKNFIEPAKKTLSADDMRVYRAAINDELRAAKEDLKALERAQRSAEKVADVVSPLAAVERMRESSPPGSSSGFGSDRMKAIVKEWQEEAKPRRRDKKSDFEPGA